MAGMREETVMGRKSLKMLALKTLVSGARLCQGA
ncbi:hypothetical protein C100_20300 [Sphingobium sp. C100]|nr:hypothetical protein C100_20300 [Sphingobium sp. C100]